MKLKIFIFPLILFAASTYSVSAENSDAVEISWDNPESFSDLDENGYQFSQSLFERLKTEFESMIQDAASEYLPKGYQLTINFKDIDLAGEFEPWVIDAPYVRYVRNIYPPRLKFQYEIVDDSGKNVKSGLAQITDLTYLWNLSAGFFDNDEFYHEKELLENWLNKTLKNLSSR